LFFGGLCATNYKKKFFYKKRGEKKNTPLCYIRGFKKKGGGGGGEEKPNKQMQTIPNQLLQLSASGFEVLMETSTKITSKTTGLTTWHHIQEITCLVNKPNHCSPSEHYHHICTE